MTDQNKKGFSTSVLVLVVGVVGLFIAFGYKGVVNQYGSSVIKDLLSEAHAQAEVYYNKQVPPSYTASTMLTPGSTCTGDMFDGNFNDNLQYITGDKSVWPEGTTLSCQATSLQYAISALLPVGEGEEEDLNVWCVDSTGRSMWVKNHLVQGDTNCN